MMCSFDIAKQKASIEVGTSVEAISLVDGYGEPHRLSGYNFTIQCFYLQIPEPDCRLLGQHFEAA